MSYDLFLYVSSSKFKNANLLRHSFGEFEDTHSLKLDFEPIFPTNQEIPSLIRSADLMPITPIILSLTRTSNNANNDTKNEINPHFKDEDFDGILIFDTL